MTMSVGVETVARLPKYCGNCPFEKIMHGKVAHSIRRRVAFIDKADLGGLLSIILELVVGTMGEGGSPHQPSDRRLLRCTK